jgi:hypothetical protein
LTEMLDQLPSLFCALQSVYSDGTRFDDGFCWFWRGVGRQRGHGGGSWSGSRKCKRRSVDM